MPLTSWRVADVRAELLALAPAPNMVIVRNDDHNTFDGVAGALSRTLPGVTLDGGYALADDVVAHEKGSECKPLACRPQIGLGKPAFSAFQRFGCHGVGLS